MKLQTRHWHLLIFNSLLLISGCDGIKVEGPDEPIDTITLEVVGSVEFSSGWYNDILHQNSLIFLARSDLIVIDVKSPLAPEVVSTDSTLMIKRIAGMGDYLVAATTNEISLFDFSTTAFPEFVSSFQPVII